jgi:hypothetical protein
MSNDSPVLKATFSDRRRLKPDLWLRPAEKEKERDRETGRKKERETGKKRASIASNTLAETESGH